MEEQSRVEIQPQCSRGVTVRMNSQKFLVSFRNMKMIFGYHGDQFFLLSLEWGLAIFFGRDLSGTTRISCLWSDIIWG